ncbi:AAA family ATPase [Plasmodium brasilianum]|uniref:AAA family ATPase, putative n=2 Tax=Plasmodium (Plasmodium) TaxID=418103 RepID=A0A1A8VL83_PLAMA|nr:AAA family ATPase, putative [Plasmodium malariae]KAI4841212.1 AAA family ATPase [Plasmodium brasilianum]SBS81344.1 AAA family ATPase, putative [Plasmodium malariae]SBT86896.1 AAA family ATPase, putative [Plasmodium malariae]
MGSGPPSGNKYGYTDEKVGEHITGNFDPTALERGAKALKELDQSSNSKKAFELIKLQELTKQKEYEKQMEELSLQRAQYLSNKTRIENEERRKTINYQQEQERVTAEYKTRLEAEAYQKKLLDQQKQNEEWLRNQHEQYLRQENIRKRNELELMNLKMKQIREEKSLERENMKARIYEENKGLIERERKNLDIHLKTLKAKADEERKTKIESINKYFEQFNNSLFLFLNDKEKVYRFALAVTLTSLGVYATKHTTRFIRTYTETKLGKPKLIRETSLWHINKFFDLFNLKRNFSLFKKYIVVQVNGGGDKAHHKVANIKSGSGSGSDSSSNMFDQIVLNEELQEKLTWSINSLRNSKKYDLYLKNILLHGPPGTGKTLFAKTVSYYSNFDYIIINGGDVSALGIHASVELNKIFEFVKKRKNKKCIIFIDEAEAFLRKGRNESFINFSEHLRNALASFLYHTGTESKNFGVILATNCRDILDPAVMDRIDEQYNFDIPQISEIKKMVSVYFNKYVFPLKKYNIIIDDSVDDNYLDDIARRLYGLSGRQISKLCLNIQNTVFGSNSKVVSKELIDLIINWNLSNAFDVGEVGTGRQTATDSQPHQGTRQYEKQSEMRNEQYETHNNTQISSYNPRQNSGSHNTANSNSRKMENKVVLNHVL